MKNLSVLLGIILGFIFSGIVFLVAQQPRGQPLELKPVPTSNLLIIHISGAVKTPGVYNLSNPSRVADAVQAAGGFDGSELLDAVNLAASLSDGQKIYIPSILSETSKKSPDLTLRATESISAPTSDVNYPININTAAAITLERLPGIGPSKAQQIVLYRQEHGFFKTIEDLLNVTGIGQTTFDQLKGLISISDLP